MPRSTPLAASQNIRLQQSGCARSVDVHCHVLPGIDDGPQNIAEAMTLCRAMVQDGFTDAIATPHQLGRWDGSNSAHQVRDAVKALQEQLDAKGVPLEVHAGGEVRLDERIPQLLASGKILTLADHGIHLLLELPLGLAVDPAVLIPYLTAGGANVVLAHAERYDALLKDPGVVEKWLEHGVAIQINAPTYAGGTDERSEAAAWKWLERGWVALVASDAHSTNTRRPRMTEAIARITERLGPDVARKTCIENPSRILEGKPLAAGG